jgi:8-oxo-dGTP diphosphatase
MSAPRPDISRFYALYSQRVSKYWGVERLSDIDWKQWRAKDPATLVFAVRDDSVLLIRKKRGLGAGKINAPGGRIEPGETALEGAVREVQEEVCITPLDLRWCGENRFQFVDGYSIHVHVFRADDFEGTPTETNEATPLWYPLEAIPYHEMWEDDHLWVPLVFEGTPFVGRYLFDDDVMLDHELEIGDRGGPRP